MKTIRASELGTYLYCARAWSYDRQGFDSTNQTEMNSGTELHRQHGRKVLASNLVRTVALILFLVALTLLVAFCTSRVI
jgi:hypothetical protein